MNQYQTLNFNGYEKVMYCSNDVVGFKGWIAVHNSNLGPALGGCRLWNYTSDEEALYDVLRLSKGMTYKNALAKLSLGGGKAVIQADPDKINRKELFEAFGLFIEELKGKYITAEDMNTSLDDMKVINSKTDHVASLKGSGNPSPMTAYGVFCGIKSSVRYLTGSDDLSNMTVAIQGVGQTGYRLAKMLRDENCRIIAADVNKDHINALEDIINFTDVEPDDIYSVNCDVFAPCAMGGVLNDETIPQLNCKIVAGSANNQLLEEEHGKVLKDRGILYAPDFVVNAGGIINISCEINKEYDLNEARSITAGIAQTLNDVYTQSDSQNQPTNLIANQLAEQIFLK